MEAGRRNKLVRFIGLGAVALLVSSSACRTTPTSPSPPSRPIAPQIWTGEGLTGRLLMTEHFEIISTLEDQPFEAAIPEFLEAAYAQYTETLPPPPGEHARLTTFIFARRSQWKRFTLRRFPTRFGVYARIVSGGFTEHDTSLSFYTTRSAMLATLAHEGWHQYVGARFSATMPAWLNEGLACYHETVDFAGPTPKFTPQNNTFRTNSLRSAIQENRLLTLREIIDTDAGNIITHGDSETTQAYYAQTWALVTFLKHGAEQRYAPAFQQLLDHIADGTFEIRASAARITGRAATGESTSVAAFRKYFLRTPEELEDEYRSHLLKIAGFQ